MSPGAIEEAFDRQVANILPRFSAGVLLIFGIIALSHLLFRWSISYPILGAASVLATLAMFGFRGLLNRQPPIARTQILALAPFLLAAGLSSLHLALTREPSMAFGFVLLNSAAGGVLMSWTALAIVWGISWTTWAVALLAWSFAGVPAEGHAIAITGASLALSTCLGAFFHKLRRNDTLRYEQSIAELTQAAEQIGSAKRAADSANKAKSDFLTRVSHELRTPLNGVIGMADLLLDSKLDPDQRADTQTLRESAGHLQSIIEDLLDLSRIEARKLNLSPADCDLHQTLRSAVESIRPAAAKKGLELGHEFSSSLPRWVHLDSQKLRQVLFNLLSNAVKFTEQGSVRVTADATPMPDAGWRLKISVIDTGQGIESTALGRLFQPFELGDLSSSRRHSGTGLGLTISRQLAGLMGGRIEVRSLLHKGSEFIIEIPASPPDHPVPEPVDPQSAASSTTSQVGDAGGHGFKPLRVLLVDDNNINRTLAVKLLTRMGHETVMARDGQEAITWANKEPFDVILMDCVMPGMDGISATKELRYQLKDRCPRIVALTAEASESDRRKCLEAGMDEYLSKPFTRDALEACLYRVTHSNPGNAVTAS